MVSDEERSKLILNIFDKTTNYSFDAKGKVTPGVIPPSSRKIGVFHQDVNEFNSNYPPDKEVLYISYGLFEDEFLNNLIVKII